MTEKYTACGRLVCDIKISCKELIRCKSYDLTGKLCCCFFFLSWFVLLRLFCSSVINKDLSIWEIRFSSRSKLVSEKQLYIRFLTIWSEVKWKFAMSFGNDFWKKWVAINWGLNWNGSALQLYWNHTSTWVFSCKFATYFQNTFSKEHLWMATSFLLLLSDISCVNSQL